MLIFTAGRRSPLWSLWLGKQSQSLYLHPALLPGVLATCQSVRFYNQTIIQDSTEGTHRKVDLKVQNVVYFHHLSHPFLVTATRDCVSHDLWHFSCIPHTQGYMPVFTAYQSDNF